jgi:MATE family multidrug resistance protein
LAWPIAVSTLSYSTMTLVDTAFVGHLGTGALAGVGLGSTIAFALLCFALGLLRSVKVLVSQSDGAGKRDSAPAYLGAGLFCAVSLGGCAVVLGELLAPAVSQLAATPTAASSALAYLHVRVLGTPLALTHIALREARYGLGDSRSPMKATVVSNLANVVLDYLLIFEAGMGVAGAAWASVMAQGLEAALLVSVQRRREGLGLRQVRAAHVLSVLRLGLPTGLQFALEVGSFALLAGMISTFGEVDMAAHQIAIQVIHFSFLPALAVGEAASVMVGQAVGAGRDALVKPVAHRALALAAAYTGACTVPLALAGVPLASVFTGDLGVQQTAAELLLVAAVFQVFDGSHVVGRCLLLGAGDVRVPAVVGIVTAWLLTPPLAWLLGEWAGWGAVGGWIGLCAEIIVGAGIYWWRVERDGWLPSASRSRADLQGADELGAQARPVQPAVCVPD